MAEIPSLEIIELEPEELEAFLATHPGREKQHTFPYEDQQDGQRIYFAPHNAVVALKTFLETGRPPEEA